MPASPSPSALSNSGCSAARDVTVPSSMLVPSGATFPSNANCTCLVARFTRARSPCCFTTERSAVSPRSRRRSIATAPSVGGINGWNTPSGTPRASTVAARSAGSSVNLPAASKGDASVTSARSVASRLPATRATTSALRARSPAAPFAASSLSVLKSRSPTLVGHTMLLAATLTVPVVPARSLPPDAAKASFASTSIEISPSFPCARVEPSSPTVTALPTNAISPPRSLSAYSAPPGPFAVKSIPSSVIVTLRVPSGDPLPDGCGAELSCAGFASLASPRRPCSSRVVCADPVSASDTSLPRSSASSPSRTSALNSTRPASGPPSIEKPSTFCPANQPRSTSFTATVPLTCFAVSCSITPRT